MAETQSSSDGAKVRFPPPLVFLSLIGAGFWFQHWIGALTSSLPFWLRLTGGVLVAVGIASMVSAALGMKRTGQSPIPWKPTPELLVKGIFGFTRNPMYLGMTAIQIGLGLVFSNLWIAAFAPVALAVIHLVAVKPEEAYLTDKFGESYLKYKTSVRRYI